MSLTSITVRETNSNRLPACLPARTVNTWHSVIHHQEALKEVTPWLHSSCHEELGKKIGSNVMIVTTLRLLDYGLCCWRSEVINRDVIADIREVSPLQSEDHLYCDILIFII